MLKNYKEIALKMHEAGLRIIPVDTTKAPACKSWREYQKAQSKESVEEIFAADCFGIAMLTGTGEEHKIEALDIDLKYDLTLTMFNDFIKTLESFENVDFSELFVQTTMSGGYHLVYRCEEIETNKKLAKRPATQEELDAYNQKVDEHNAKKSDDQKARKKKTDVYKLPQVLFETRGEGGYILVSPSTGYEVQQGTIFDIPVVTPEQRQSILNAARTFNEVHQAADLSAKTKEQKKVARRADDKDVKPLDDFNERGDVEALLYSHSWERINEQRDRIFYRRPMKSKGISGDYNTRLRLFKTWSTSTELESEKAYSPAALFCELEHDGDFSAAAKALYAEGYGSRLESSSAIEGLSNSIGYQYTDDSSQEQQLDKQKAEDDFFQKFLKTRFDIHKKPKNVEVVLKIHSESKTYDVGGFGMFGLIVGKEKSGKSTVTSVTVASAINSGAPLMNMTLDVGDKDIVFLDTEQSDFFYYHTQKRTLKYGGKTDNHEKYHAFSMKQYTVAERVFLIDKLIAHFPNLGLLVIDGLLDLCDNFNHEEKAKATIDHVTRWRDTSGALVLGILHIGKGQFNNMLGHLGGYASRKCDFALEVTPNKEEMTTEVSPRLSRFEPFTGFEFARDHDGVPKLKDSALNILGSSSVEGLSQREETDNRNKIEPDRSAQQMREAKERQRIAEGAEADDDDCPF